MRLRFFHTALALAIATTLAMAVEPPAAALAGPSATGGLTASSAPGSGMVAAAKKTPAQKKAEKAAKAAAKKAKKLAKYCAKKKNKTKKKCRALATSPSPAVAVTTGGVSTITPNSAILGKMAKWTTVNQYTRHYYLIRSYMESFERSGGGTLVLGPGEYRMSSTIYVPSRTTIQLADGARIVKINQTGTSKFGPADSIFMLIRPSAGKTKGAVGGHGGDSDINILGAGPGRSVIDLADVRDSLAIIAGHNQRVTISGITFRHMNNNHFVEMDACASCVISNNEFLDAAAGTRSTAEAINLDTPDPATGGFGAPWSNHDSTPNEGILVENNLFADLQRAVGTHNFSPNRYHDDVVVRGNTIRNMKDSSTQSGALVIMNWRNAQIVGNNISGNRIGINACGTHNPTITGNSFSDISNEAIRFRNCHSDDGNGDTATNQLNADNVAAMRNNAADASVDGPWARGVGLDDLDYFVGHEPPITVPGSPSVWISAGVDRGTAVVHWNAANASSRGPVTGYRVYTYSDMNRTLVPGVPNPLVLDASVQVATVTGLPVGHPYWFAVSAVNVAGEGPASYPQQLTLAAPPGAPTALAVVGQEAPNFMLYPTLTWLAPTETGGVPLEEYRIYLYSDPAATTLATIPGMSNPMEVFGTRATLSLLSSASTTYWARVTASNSAGEGAASDAVAILPAGAPASVTGQPGVEGQVEITWTLPRTKPQGTTGYRIYAYTDKAGTELAEAGTTLQTGAANPVAVTGENATTGTFKKLVKGRTYYFRVRATGTGGQEGPASLVSSGVVAP